jgi:hypothetical protein
MTRDVVAIHQPNYLPWLGWFAKALQADRMILLDDVQFSRGSYTHRVEVKTPTGVTRLSVPVRRGSVGFQSIADVQISYDRRWAAQHSGTLQQSYGKSPGWRRFGPEITALLNASEPSLCRLNHALLDVLRRGLAIETPFVSSASWGARETGGSAAIALLCERAGAAVYLSGSGGQSYNVEDDFTERGVELRYTRFEHPTYDQLHGEFAPGLSTLDLLFNAPDEAPEILRRGVG